MTFVAIYSNLHKRWLVPDPDIGGIVFASGASKDEAEFNAYRRWEERNT